MDPAILTDAYRYWLGTLSGRDDFPEAKAPLWFTRSDETDAHIRDAYGPHLASARAAGLDGLDREQRVGLVIMLDQFPRNIFRQSGEAFAYDARAREIARELIAAGLEEYPLVERVFLFLPFEHSEDVADQDRAVRLYAELIDLAPEDQKERHREYLDYATRHRDLIRRFGRFPHRNAMLGRPSTPEEEAFAREHGRGY
jgi:uncharacterized protein (DUF924 family)